METVSLFDAKTHFSRLVDRIASGAAKEIVISRNGKPVVRLVPIGVDTTQRVGIAKGMFEVPDDIDAHNADVAGLFLSGR